MDKVLIIIPHQKLRQLYHELLVDNQYELYVAADLVDGVSFMAISPFDFMILFEIKEDEVQVLLNLRSKKKNWRNLKFIIVTEEPNLYSQIIDKVDKVYGTNLSAKEIVRSIRKAIMGS